MVSWERLRVFAAVAQCGSVQAAAEKLHVTPPAVSQHIRRLERETGCTLVERDGRGIRLTHAGRVVAGSAQRMAAEATQATKDLAAVSGLIAGPLRVGAIASALGALVPRALVDLTRRHPRLEPEVSDGEAATMLQELQAGRLDVVVMESWAHTPARIPRSLRIRTLVREPVMLAVHPGHALAHLTEAPISSMRGLLWSSCPKGSGPHLALVQLLRQHGESPVRIRHQVSDYTTQLRLAASGIAASLVPRMALPEDTSGLCVLPCRPGIFRTVAAATAESTETAAALAFVEEMVRVSANAEERPDRA